MDDEPLLLPKDEVPPLRGEDDKLPLQLGEDNELPLLLEDELPLLRGEDDGGLDCADQYGRQAATIPGGQASAAAQVG